MSNRKKYTPKVEGYVPKAIDGDGDGLVQDGTEFEREVGTELAEFVDVVDEPAVTLNEKTYTLKEGENIQLVAGKFKPANMTRQDYAKQLFAKNKSWTVGAVIHIV